MVKYIMEKHPNKHQITPFLDINSKALASVVVVETKLIGTWLYQKTENTRKAYETDLKLFFKHYSGLSLIHI